MQTTIKLTLPSIRYSIIGLLVISIRKIKRILSMNNISALILVCILTNSIIGQANENTANNLSFENIVNDKALNWKKFGKGDYSLKIDTIVSQNGNNSASIEFNGGKPNFKAWAYPIPAIYSGKKIKLTGYIKTENVSDGYAGLWMRIDPSVGFDNMRNRGIVGTTDWKEYQIELDLKSTKAKKIVIGGILVGKGKMWVDNLKVTIDGNQLDSVPLKEIFKAEMDTEFNKGSKLHSIVLNNQKIENLKTLGMIWGFLKYYHPNITSGNYNWDFELFRILPKIIEAKNTKERDEYLVNWINGFGDFEQFKDEKKEQIENVKINPDLNWIISSKFSDELMSALTKIIKAKRTNDENYYIGLYEGAGNPDFKNEATYSEMKYPDAGFRLLSLFRYWNIIQYYFPYKNLIEEDWKNVLNEFIPLFIHSKNEIEYKLTVLELITRIHDTHANIWGGDLTLNEYWGLNYASIELTFIENKVIVTGFFDEKLGQETGLQIGDEITKINNELISKIIPEKLKYIPASNDPTQLRDLAKKLLRTNSKMINIEYKQDEITQTKSIKAYSISEFNIYKNNPNEDDYFKLINKEIAYINNGSLKKEYLPQIWKSIENTKGLIIDIRNYPSDFPLYELSKLLMPKSMPFAIFTNGSLKNPGLFKYKKPLIIGEKNHNYYKGKVVIIVNESTQSSAEFHAMAYRAHPNSIVIGSTTAGSDGNISLFYLPGNIKTMISGIGVYYPGKTETQRIGIIPDIEIKPTIEGIRNNRDELLEKAIELIEKNFLN